MKIIDISNNNGDIDFTQMKSDGIDGVLIKATEGKTYQNPRFNDYYAKAKQAKLLVGAYHYSQNNLPEDEVNNFLNIVKDKMNDFDLKYFIDREIDKLPAILFRNKNSQKVREFADIMIKKGYKDIGLYTGEWYYNNSLNDTVKDIPLWVAKYSKSRPNVNKYIGWQYSSTLSLPNASKHVFDISDFSDEILIKKTVGQAPAPKPIVVDKSTSILQIQLVRLHIANLKIDNIYGKNTTAAVKKFQSIMGLEVDGKAGRITKSTIDIIFQKITCKRNLDNNPIPVRYIQFTVGADIDGKYGPDTEKHVKAWQKRNHLEIDGSFGPQSWKCAIG